MCVLDVFMLVILNWRTGWDWMTNTACFTWELTIGLLLKWNVFSYEIMFSTFLISHSLPWNYIFSVFVSCLFSWVLTMVYYYITIYRDSIYITHMCAVVCYFMFWGVMKIEVCFLGFNVLIYFLGINLIFNFLWEWYIILRSYLRFRKLRPFWS